MPSSYSLTRALFLRALGAVYLIAFGSLAVQMPGLYGSQGILPIADFIGTRQPPSLSAVWNIPTLFWLNSSDLFLQAVPMAGVLLSLLLIVGIAHRVNLILVFSLYLSLVAAGQDFMQFQWDALLLEVGFIAIFLRDSNLALWLYRWLVFRLMVLSGLVKILSGDPNWRNLTALDYHFMTQPLPNVVGWYVYHLPSPVHQFMVAATFFIELVVPFGSFAPRRVRFIAAALIALLQMQIFVTGNYNFFNLLVMALCILLLDDAALRAAWGALAARSPAAWRVRSAERTGSSQEHGLFRDPRITQIKRIRLALFALFADQAAAREGAGEVSPSSTPDGQPARAIRLAMRWIANAVVIVVFVLSAFQFLALAGIRPPGIVSTLSNLVEPFRLVNFYGPFAVMTTSRPEIIVEGSNDGEGWVEYEFKYKPGNLRRAPPQVEPHQPRLDWQMWFAALGSRNGDPTSLLPELRASPAMLFNLQNYDVEPWFVNFEVRLLQGSPQVLGLMGRNPFPDAPPRFIRARLYLYRFTDLAAPTTTGEWWTRAEQGLYLPPLTLGE